MALVEHIEVPQCEHNHSSGEPQNHVLKHTELAIIQKVRSHRPRTDLSMYLLCEEVYMNGEGNNAP